MIARIFCSVRHMFLLSGLVVIASYGIFGVSVHYDATKDFDHDKLTNMSIRNGLFNNKNKNTSLPSSISLGKSLKETMSAGLHELGENLSDGIRKIEGNLHNNYQKNSDLENHREGGDDEHYASPPRFRQDVMPVNDGLDAVDWSLITDEDISELVDKLVHNANNNKVQKGKVDGAEFYWQMPILSNRKLLKNEKYPRGILFLAHACRQRAADWFSSLSERAPEEAAIVEIARKRGMMVIAMSSLNQRNKCFDRQDGPRVANVLQHIEKRQSKIFFALQYNGHVPMYAFGSDTGAMFISSYLSQASQKHLGSVKANIALNGIIVQNVGARLTPNIPAVYMTMPKEEKQHHELDVALEEYTGKAEHIELQSILLTPMLLHERIKSITKKQSQKFFELMGKEGLVETEEGRLLRTPTHDPMTQKVVERFVSKDKYLNGDVVHAIIEVLTVVWGHHATTRDGFDEALDW
eukprot:CAMPEP_0198149582 /NCGR_PEP_ID=MMETSP1443-20131203/47266_1 /TAXON_ID=186043 /ORGANISM="Entomoneis sp., Strain CCMP2396" /LENGTH=465 /DNA_ID=CAMNT_0043814667 /DNA_START=350 /DNA_END=1744 /DNA_ORIENTATION=+